MTTRKLYVSHMTTFAFQHRVEHPIRHNLRRTLPGSDIHADVKIVRPTPQTVSQASPSLQQVDR
jgi:hypothetical protein